MSAVEERRIGIVSGDLALEAAIHDGDGALAVLVLHPHPQYGGDMDNHVVTAICGAMAARGATTLRFNFRGAGRSQGAYDNGRGEADDARAALETLRSAAPGAKMLLAGYSFGAMIAAGVAAGAELAALVLVSPPVGSAPLPPLDAELPTLLVAGDQDGIAPAPAVAGAGGRAAAGRHRRGCRPLVVAGVGFACRPDWHIRRILGALRAKPPRGYADNPCMTSATTLSEEARREVRRLVLTARLAGVVVALALAAGSFVIHRGHLTSLASVSQLATVVVGLGSFVVLSTLTRIGHARVLERSLDEVAHLTEQLRALADRDPLTALYNMRAFYNSLDAALARRKRQAMRSAWLSLISTTSKC